MKILITGASGTVGFAALQHLINDTRYEITVFDLRNKKSLALFKPYRQRLKIIYGDIGNREDIIRACVDQDCVIHLAAIIPPLADDNPNLAERVNIQGTKNLIQAVKAGSPEAFFIYGSSISVYGDRLQNPNIKVDDPLLPSIGDEYARTKIAAEKLVRESDLDYTIIRITAVMGVNNHKISKIIFHMPLATPIELITPTDAGRAFTKMVEKRGALNQRIFNLSGGEKCRVVYHDFISRSFANYGLGKLNFPKHSFATHNFHCGHYADGDELEEILHFQSETIDDYFNHQTEGIKPLTKFLTTVFQKPIKLYLASKSEPLRAYRKQDKEMIARFFV